MARINLRLWVNSAILLISLASPFVTYPETVRTTLGNRNFYFSLNGNDDNDGRTPQTAWKTLDPLKWKSAKPGDSVLFERGSWFFGTLRMYGSGTAAKPIVFSAYGVGPKPVFIGAEQIRDSTQFWKKSGTKVNVWIFKETLDKRTNSTDTDVANLVLEDFNGRVSFGRKIMAYVPVYSRQGDFWYDYVNKQFELYSLDSPQKIYRSIQLVENINAIETKYKIDSVTWVDYNHIVFDNLDFRFYGKCVLEIGGSHCTFQNLDISYIGGGACCTNEPEKWYLSRLGNGIQMWLGEHDITVTGCRFDNIYDAAISPQGTNEGGNDMNFSVYNIFMRNNVITNCEYSFEFFEWGSDVAPDIHDIYFENNTCINAGKGWSHDQRWGMLHRNPFVSGPDPNGSHVRLERVRGVSRDVYIRNNIFYGTTDRLYWVVFPDTTGAVVSDYNAFYDPSDKPVGTLYKFEYDIPKVDVQTLKRWREKTGFETNSYHVDPMFVSENDFHLSPCSPLIGKGIDVGYGAYVGAYQPVPETVPPVIRRVSATPSELQPANHRMIDVTVGYTVKDNCGKVTTKLTVSSDEPETGVTSGDRYPDWIIVDKHHVKLRAERASKGDGRVYTINVTAIDAAGNTATRSVKVFVPRNYTTQQISGGMAVAGDMPTLENGVLECKVFPNPSSNYFDIAIRSESAGLIYITLFDVNGRQVMAKQMSDSRTIRIGQELLRGMYLAEVRQGDQSLRFKLLKQ